MTKVLVYIRKFITSESTQKFMIEFLAELISGVVTKLISGGGASAPHTMPDLAVA